jgi:disulfide oxidoreductase YuzD
MKYHRILLCVLLSGPGLAAFSQQTVDAAGGNASGSGGSASYSLGQTVYTTNTGLNGSAAKGVQQAYEISVVYGVDDMQAGCMMTVCPNPTSGFLELKVEYPDISFLKFQLLDLNGKVLESRDITRSTERIQLENFPVATYVLKVIRGITEIKTFKIIKD